MIKRVLAVGLTTKEQQKFNRRYSLFMRRQVQKLKPRFRREALLGLVRFP
jgi:hypothetical protein